MMMSSNFLHYWPYVGGGFTGPWWIPRTKASDAELSYFLLHLNKPLSKQPWGWWFEILLQQLWRHCNVFCPSPINSSMALIQMTVPLWSLTTCDYLNIDNWCNLLVNWAGTNRDTLTINIQRVWQLIHELYTTFIHYIIENHQHNIYGGNTPKMFLKYGTDMKVSNHW